jgi:hypothetical protein
MSGNPSIVVLQVAGLQAFGSEIEGDLHGAPAAGGGGVGDCVDVVVDAVRGRHESLGAHIGDGVEGEVESDG